MVAEPAAPAKVKNLPVKEEVVPEKPKRVRAPRVKKAQELVPEVVVAAVSEPPAEPVAVTKKTRRAPVKKAAVPVPDAAEVEPEIPKRAPRPRRPKKVAVTD
jgi:hypothetical protein